MSVKNLLDASSIISLGIEWIDVEHRKKRIEDEVIGE
jgi:hypothetical protein